MESDGPIDTDGGAEQHGMLTRESSRACEGDPHNLGDDGAKHRPQVLTALAEELGRIEDVDVAEHPAILEAVHRGLVAELDDLASGGRG